MSNRKLKPVVAKEKITARARTQYTDYMVFGVTIHYVDASLDGGRIIAQRAFEYDGDDIEELEARIHAVEYPLYVETIKKLLDP